MRGLCLLPVPEALALSLPGLRVWPSADVTHREVDYE
jgi:hypothetical protein